MIRKNLLSLTSLSLSLFPRLFNEEEREEREKRDRKNGKSEWVLKSWQETEGEEIKWIRVEEIILPKFLFLSLIVSLCFWPRERERREEETRKREPFKIFRTV